MPLPRSMIIYNLFPLLAGPFTGWAPHLERAKSMGFTWVFLNPVQHPGFSGSLYSIKYYFGLNPLLLDETSSLEPEAQFRKAMDHARELGLSMMTDLVINHCAVDSPLIEEHPDWFKWGKSGKVEHPWCMDGGKKVVWGDLASFDHLGTADPEGLFEFFMRIIGHLVGLGFRGFRCDAAYQLPHEFWERLIEESRARHGELVFAAETLGCSHRQTIRTARAGFDFIFNSSKWWDMESAWLLEQYAETRTVAPSISFPESHDTLRLAEELNGNIEALRQRYLFSAVFSSGCLMPIGFEYGFRKRPHVVKTRPSDWENTGIDLTGYIAEVNALKASLPILNEDAPTVVVENGNPDVLVMRKVSAADDSRLLLVMNKDASNPVALDSASPRSLLSAEGPVEDVTPGTEIRVDPEAPPALELGPAQAIVFHAPKGA